MSRIRFGSVSGWAEAALWIAVLAVICALLLAFVTAKMEEKRERRTLNDMRSVASAVVSFAVDENRYPRQDRLGPMHDDMARLLEGTYIKTLPLRDAWDQSFLYWSNETDFVLVSLGKDRRAAADLQTYRRSGDSQRVGDDILYRPGKFTRWPEGSAIDD